MANPVGSRTRDDDPINYSNLKPYRSKDLKAEAQKNATIKDGRYVSSVPTLIHPPVNS